MIHHINMALLPKTYTTQNEEKVQKSSAMDHVIRAPAKEIKAAK